MQYSVLCIYMYTYIVEYQEYFLACYVLNSSYLHDHVNMLLLEKEEKADSHYYIVLVGNYWWIKFYKFDLCLECMLG